ncbi:MAG: 6-phosphogluconate dehydrogenase, NADP(+)-dependent, decarboxylating [Candidatus Hinthialibacteria bacterium OLB16]|nr:MAG: 6-phosphogluconate dehydrogenase, NADP(+)-dependent, decarboxylating [Candidatus Hinthialibacteria bacterium OLB16]
MQKSNIGLVGLAVMGENLARNIERNGFTISVWNRTTSKVDDFIKAHPEATRLKGTHSVQEFIDSLESPRKIILMVKAGDPVDDMIRQIRPYLTRGDILIDGGNSFFQDTRRRHADLARDGILYIGSGVSGGEEGALWGPSLMPGGPKEAYAQIEPIWKKIAAQVDSSPCTTYVGPDGAGHFVKMVHNGIEYGDMQLIAETYDLLKTALDLPAAELARIFEKWNQGVLSSYLIEITYKVFQKVDPETGKPLVDLILDKAGQKGTGKWTTQIALDLGVPTPTINAAVEARILSSFKEERVAASARLKGPKPVYRGPREKLIEAAHEALFASKICSYAQGMTLIRVAGEEYGWKLDLAEIARIWRGGCIIRAQFLDTIRDAFEKRKKLPNLLLDAKFKSWVKKAQPKWRFALQVANKLGVPTLAMSASMAYFDSYRRATLPANLIQAQRDYFGAHTYQRIDKEGVFHTEWTD